MHNIQHFQMTLDMYIQTGLVLAQHSNYMAVVVAMYTVYCNTYCYIVANTATVLSNVDASKACHSNYMLDCKKLSSGKCSFLQQSEVPCFYR